MDYYLQRIKNIYHFFKAVLACWYYGFPGKNITVIGVTGTDGKTTTASLIAHILRSSGKHVSSITTVSAYIGDTSYDTGFHTTTPSPFMVQRFLRQAVLAGDEYFVLETTSHALDQCRVWGIPFSYAVVTNITHEHLLYHKTYENYVAAKAKLLAWSRTGYINRDDISYEFLIQHRRPKENLYTYGKHPQADYACSWIDTQGLSLPLFNQYNYTAARAVVSHVGISDEDILRAMRSFQLPPGRMELVYEGDFRVIIDFAHTPNSLHEALSSIRTQYPDGRMIHVFGAAAFRDDSKRPLMGKESARFADVAVLTEEDYRTEDPEMIAHQIAAGLEEEGFKRLDGSSSHVPEEGFVSRQYVSIQNRHEAISYAMHRAQHGDTIVITGKGHESSLCRGTKEYPWSDKAAVLSILDEMGLSHV